MMYTIGEMASRLNVPASTLRWYDKEGLLPFVERTDSGVRIFKEEDFEWLQVIECLKKAGMKLADIREFIELSMQGDDTISQRLELITAQKRNVEQQIAELNETLRTLTFKQWYYETARQDGTTAHVRALPLENLPEEYRDVRLRLKGK